MERTLALKAIADDTRRSIIFLLLRHNFCVRALAKKLEISEAAVSQHIKVLRQAGLAVSKETPFSRGTWSVTSPDVVVRSRL